MRLYLNGSSTPALALASRIASVGFLALALLPNPLQAQTCVNVPAGLVSWWSGEGNGFDRAGLNDGHFIGGATCAPGLSGQAFAFDGNKQAVLITNASHLQFQDFTVEAWICRTDPIAVTHGSYDYSVLFGFGQGGYVLCLEHDGRLSLRQGDYGVLAIADPAIKDTQWHHVALDKSGETVTFYIDGEPQAVPSQTAVFSFSAFVAIGARGDNMDASFIGLIDELAVYNRALSRVEIQSIYNARELGKCNSPDFPTIVEQPVNRSILPGFSTQLAVVVTGARPLSYQWYFEGGPILDATNSSLALNDAAFGNSGTYFVSASNSFGMVTSRNAIVTIDPATACMAAPEGLVSWWPGEGDALDARGGNHGIVNSNVLFVPAAVGRGFLFNGRAPILVGNGSNLRLQDFTIATLIKRSNPTMASTGPGGDAVIFGFGDGGYALTLDAAGRLGLSQYSYGGISLANPRINDTNLHHVAVTRSNSIVVFYVDGVKQPEMWYSGNFHFNTPAAIGGPGDNPKKSFLGVVDELSIYSRPLEAGEITALYASSVPGLCPQPPFIITQPVSQTIYPGMIASFQVKAVGSPQLRYQWQFKGAGLLGATDSSLTLTNSQESDGGLYSVVVSNTTGVIASSPATLTLNSPGAPLIPPGGLVGWWPGDGNTLDSTGTNHGILIGDASFAQAKVHEGFALDGIGQCVNLANPKALQLQNFTIETWIRRLDAATCSYSPAGDGFLFSFSSGGYSFVLHRDGALALSKTDYGIEVALSDPKILDTNFHHVAVSKQGTTLRFYVDGRPYLASDFPAEFNFSTTAAIGARGYSHDGSFLGVIDEMSIYSRALEVGELQSIYLAAAQGKYEGATPPQLLAIPLNQRSYAGQTVSFDVLASGSRPLSYQWMFKGNPLAGETKSTLVLTNVQAGGVGVYSVEVSNSYGLVSSPGATLQIEPAPPCLPAFPGLVSWWRAEGDGFDQMGVNHGIQSNGVTFAAGRIGQAFIFKGRDHGVLIANPLNMPKQDFTVETWIKRASVEMTSYGLYGNAALLSSGATGAGVYLDQYGYLILGQPNGGWRGPAITDRNWHHVAITREGNQVSYYLDGLNYGNYTDATLTFTAPLAIGYRADIEDNGFLGAIDELSIYRRALSGAEIQSIYGSPVSGKCPLQLPPEIVAQPSDQTVLVGLGAAFEVTATGSPPLAYQWSFNGEAMAGATDPDLAIPVAQTNHAGVYAVSISNEFGRVFSSNAVLTVGRAQSCSSPPDGLVGWWPADGDSSDWVGSNPGTPVSNPRYGPGKVGRAFVLNSSGQGIKIGNPSVLQLQDFTIEGWIQRGSDATVSSSIGAMLFAYGSGGYGFYLDASGHLGLTQIDGPGLTLYESGIHDTNFHHVAVTKEGASLLFYIDGKAFSAGAYNPPMFAFNTPAAIGARGDNMGNSFLGSIDEMSIYNRALDPGEILAIFHSSSSGKCPTPPVIFQQPRSQTVYLGQDATLQAIAGGSPQLSYQWTMNGAALKDGTHSILTIPNASTNDAGRFSLIVSNLYGQVVTTNVTLSVIPPPACSPPPLGLVGWWPAEGNTSDAASGNDGSPIGDWSYGPGEVRQAFVFNGYRQGVGLGNPAILQLQNFTIEAWIQRSSLTVVSQDGLACLFGYGSRGYAFNLDGSGRLSLSQVDYSSAVLYDAAIIDTNLHHVAVTKDGGNVAFYIDGRRYSVGAYNPVFEFYYPAAIGARADYGAYSFWGKIDELAIYNHALSETEIGAIFDAKLSGKCSLQSAFEILSQPEDQTVFVGTPATFKVLARGLPPLQYQWRFNNADIMGATNSSFTIPSAKLSDSGLYALVISNSWGSILSSIATLTVRTAPPCVAPLLSLVAWWPGESNAQDLVSGDMGAVHFGLSTQPGEVGNGFANNGGWVSVGNPKQLQLQDFTIEGWIRRASQSAVGYNSSDGYLFSYGDGGYAFYLDSGGYLGISQSGYSAMTLNNRSISDTNFHHVAVTKAGSSVFFYIDGVGYPAPRSYAPTFIFNSSASIGARGDYGWQSFLGSIDELSIYSRELTGPEIYSIYAAAVSGKCDVHAPPSFLSQPTNTTVYEGFPAQLCASAYGRLPISYQWLLNGAPVAGETNAALSMANTRAQDSGVYALIVSNVFGTATSSNATLFVNTLPPCLPAPPGLVSWWPGQSSVKDSVGANDGGLVGNPRFVRGMVGDAFAFDANFEGVAVGNSASLQLQDFTIEAWIERASSSTVSASWGSAVLFGYGTGGYGFLIDYNGHLVLSQMDYGAVTSMSPAITDTNFHHVAVTKSGSALTFFIDGVCYLAPDAFNPTFSFNTSAAIGARGDNFYNVFLGAIDEVSLYNRALLPVEIQLIYGSFASGKCLRAYTAPVIVSQPADQTVVETTSASFAVLAYGAEPLTYQWRFNGTNLAGALASTLTISNAAGNVSGAYDVVITNTFGAITSVVATLSVVPPPPCAATIPGLVSWWPGQFNSLDVVGVGDGTWAGDANYGPGKVGQAFVFNGSWQGVRIGSPEALHLQNFTIEAWVRRSSAMSVSSSGSGMIFGFGNAGYGLYLDWSGRLTLAQIDGGAVATSGPNIVDTLFHYVAVTKSSEKVIFYLDGTAYTAPYDFNPVFSFNTTAAIGARGDYLDNSFLGAIDELGIYHRALSAEELHSIFMAGLSGKCNSEQSPPVIVEQPFDKTVAVGSAAVFETQAVGGAPLTYQWRFGRISLARATNATLVITNAQAADSGFYSLVIRNAYGIVTSSNANLSVVPAPPCLNAPTGLVSWWRGEADSLDSFGVNDGASPGNVGYGYGAIGKGYVFTQPGQGITLDNPSSLHLQNFSIECWIRRENDWFISPSGVNAVLFGFGSAGYVFSMDSAGNLALGQTFGEAVRAVNRPINDTHFHHVAVTKSAEVVVFYIDGVGYAADRGLNATFDFNGSAAIGTSVNNSNDVFLGTIDELSIYNRPLSAEEIRSLAGASLTGKCAIQTGPKIISQPVGQSVTISSSVTFTCEVRSSDSLMYQWFFNGKELSGATNNIFTLSNVQIENTGYYSVVVSNLIGSVTSEDAFLNVVAPSSCLPPSSGLVGWWPAEGNTENLSGGTNGFWPGNPAFSAGEVGEAFDFNANRQGVGLGNPVSLRLQDFTIELWLRRASNWIASSSGGPAFLFSYGSGGYGFYLDGLGRLALAQNDSNPITSRGAAVVDTRFHHVAVTKSGSNLVFFVDGIGYPTAGYLPSFTFSTSAAIGARGDSPDRTFLGLIDEVSIYNRQLSEAEIHSIYIASQSGKCRPSTVFPHIEAALDQGQLVLSWPISVWPVKLQSSQSPILIDWRDMTGAKLLTNSITIRTKVSSSSPQMYYRLVLPVSSQ